MITATASRDLEIEGSFNLGYIWLSALVVALGGLLFGWDWVVVGGAKPFFESFFKLDNPALVGWANSCHLIGCLVGALVAGALSDRFGRKRLLILAAVIFGVTSVGNALAPTFAVFITWRILGGVAIGLASSLSPMYISEISPAQMRGKLVSINQLTLVLGILLAQAINWYLVRNLPVGATDAFIRNSWFGQSGWRWMFGLTAVPSALFLIGLLFVPESPRWLAKNAQADRARAILSRIGGAGYSGAAMDEIGASLSSEAATKVRLGELLEPKMRRVLVLGVVLAVFQQWCGINVIFNYAEEIFRAAGYDISSVLKNIAWTGSVNLAFTFVALGTVDRRGRRPLMLLGAGGLALIYIGIGACYAAGVQGFPPASGSGGHRLLCNVACPGDVGHHFRDISQPRARGGDVRRDRRALDRLLCPYLHVPDAERPTGICREVLAVSRGVRRGIPLHPRQAPRDEGKDAGAAGVGPGGKSRIAPRANRRSFPLAEAAQFCSAWGMPHASSHP